MLLSRVSVLQHLCGRTACVSLCVCVCILWLVCVHVSVCVNGSCIQGEENSHTEMCAAAACSCLWGCSVCYTHVGRRRRSRRGEQRWITSDLKDRNNECETLLCPSNTNRRFCLQRYWFPFFFHLEKHGSHSRRTTCLHDHIIEMQRERRGGFGDLFTNNKMSKKR